MVKVTCEIEDYSNPSMPCIKIHNCWITKHNVEIEVDGKRYTVNGEELIIAVKNCMNTNLLG